jgi:HlyD family secretion protein
MGKFLRKLFRVTFLLGVVAVAGLAALIYWANKRASALPAGIVQGNGRLEAIQVNVSTKEPGRVAEVLAREGDLVEPGQVLARMDTTTLDAQLAKTKASLAEAEANAGVSNASIKRRESELKLADQQFARVKNLFSRNVAPRAEYDQAESNWKTAKAALSEEQAHLNTANQSIEVASAEVKHTQTRLDDAVLKSPVKGRVLYRLAENGEVLPSGGKVLTLVNLTDVYMEIFLPATEAARVRIGADSRITLDAAPGHAAKATVSYVSPEAQFTPKQVETRSERDKLMFRVKIQVPPEDAIAFIERIKTGVRGVGYIKIDDSVTWPESLQKPFPRPPARESRETAQAVGKAA